MNNNELEKSFEYYLNNLKELEKKYPNKFIVIKDCDIIGIYDTYENAFYETSKKFKLGTFLIQKANSNPNNYTFTLNRFAVSSL